jgi:hypothetical protein
MKNTLRLLGSLALAVVSASLVHAQAAYGYAQGQAEVAFLGSSAAGGLYLFQSGSTAGYQTPLEVGSAGTYSYSFGGTYSRFGVSGLYSSSEGGSEASPIGLAAYGTSLDLQYKLTNGNNYTAFVSVGVYTGAFAQAFDSASGQVGFGYAYGAVYVDHTLLQSTSAEASTDALFGGGNYTASYNYDPYTGGNYAFNRYPYGAPYSDYTVVGEYSTFDDQGYTFELGAGQSITVDIVSGDDTHAYALAASPTPGPIAAAPFALGLLGARKRRKNRA